MTETEAQEAAQNNAATETAEPMPEKKMVPLAALQHERATRKELQQRLARMEDRFQSFMAAKPEPGGEDAGGDPLATLKDAHARTSETVEQIRAALSRRQMAELHAAAQAQLMERYHDAVRAFAEKAPDFADAYDHACADRDAELQEMGYGNPALRRQIIAAEEAALVARSLDEGADPAERIYKLARRRGWRGADAGGEPAAEHLERVARGQAAARSLSAGGGAAPMPPRLEDLANMSDEEFAAATQGPNWRRLLQG